MTARTDFVAKIDRRSDISLPVLSKMPSWFVLCDSPHAHSQ
ncbi:hypothetical protein [Caldibacillus sp. 210928-DFI.2.22]|nr:hypothetical protein [Caldibacillus sp. 210928-DFI.2.22]